MTPSAIVTGAGSGIGHQTALALARAGYDLTVVGRRGSVLQEAADAVAAESGVTVQTLVLDVGRPGAAPDAVRAHLERFGRLDAAVTAAGIYVETPASQVTSSTWDTIMHVNLRGSALLAMEAARAMVATGGGRIVLISSVSGFYAEKQVFDYNASKAGIISVAQSLAVDFAPQGVVVNAVAPGWIDTPQAHEHIVQLSPESLLRINPLGRAGRPEEIAQVIRFLVCEAPPFLTGSTVVVDGGQTAQAPVG